MDSEQGTSRKYHLECPRDCSTVWRDGDLAKIAKKVARHWNREHESTLKHRYDVFNTKERGGGKVHDNVYQVQRIHERITAFDVMKRIGLEDGFAVRKDSKRVCVDCHRRIIDLDAATALDPEPLRDEEYRCEECEKDRVVEQREESNQQLTEFGT